MRKLIIYLSVLVLFIISTSNCQNPGEINRNTLKFKESINKVEGSLRVVNNLMKKILPAQGGMLGYYFDDSSNFVINNIRIDSLNIETAEMLKNFTDKERKELITEAQFLHNNYLSSAFLDKPCKCYLYSYHEVNNPSFKTDRIIYLHEEKKDYQTLLAERAILDRQGNLVLIGYNLNFSK